MNGSVFERILTHLDVNSRGGRPARPHGAAAAAPAATFPPGKVLLRVHCIESGRVEGAMAPRVDGMLVDEDTSCR